MTCLAKILLIKRVQIERLRPGAEDLVLFLILLVGFWLRFDGLDWGNKSGMRFHPDERRFTEQAQALDRGRPLNKTYVFGFGEAIRAVHMVLPSVNYAHIGRAISLVSGLLLCLVIFAIARELKLSRAAAALGCALISLNTLCVINSHYGTADMTYVLLLYFFALCVLREWSLMAAIVAGAVMAAKFGLILVPSLLWLMWRRRARGILLVVLTVLVFLAAQGFTFDSTSLHMIWSDMRNDTIGGFDHQKWQNIITYLGIAIRALGIPVFIFAVAGLVRARGREALHAIADGDRRHTRIIAFLPFALHAVGLLGISTTFPRHALPLVPLAIIVAAGAIEKTSHFRAVAGFCLVWSGLLAWSDGRVFRDDPRERAVREIQKIRPDYSFKSMAKQTQFQIRPDHVFKSMAKETQFVMIVESRAGRLKRSEINPLRAPNERELYHVSKEEFERYRRFNEEVARGRWKQVFEAGPLNILPEQFLYDAAWGSFEKVAGKCLVYERSPFRP